MSGRKWTDDELKILQDMSIKKYSIPEIKQALGRPTNSIISRLKKMNISLAKHSRAALLRKSHYSRGNSVHRDGLAPAKAIETSYTFATAPRGVCLYTTQDNASPNMPVCGKPLDGFFCADCKKFCFRREKGVNYSS